MATLNTLTRISTNLAIADDDLSPPAKPHLLSLPPEIRNHIYELALTEVRVSIRRTGSSPATPPARTKPPGILRACRRTYQEALIIYYQVARFQVVTSWYHDDHETIGLWLQQISERFVEEITDCRLNTACKEYWKKRHWEYIWGPTGLLWSRISDPETHARREVERAYDVHAFGNYLSRRRILLKPDVIKASVKQEDGSVVRMSFPAVRVSGRPVHTTWPFQCPQWVTFHSSRSKPG